MPYKYNPISGKLDFVLGGNITAQQAQAIEELSTKTPGSTIVGPESFTHGGTLYTVPQGQSYTVPNPISSFDPNDPALQEDDLHSYRGKYTPTANDTYPTAADIQFGSAGLREGDYFYIDTVTAFTFGGQTLAIDDRVRVNGPAPLPAGQDWTVDRFTILPTANRQPLTITTDGQTVFNLPAAVVIDNTSQVFVNGQKLALGTDYNLTVGGTVLTIVNPDYNLSTTDILEIYNP